MSPTSPPPDEKNERVLHARIPESLDKELKDKASSLGVSVSNLVRNILNNAIDLVEDVINDSSWVARSARGDKPDAAAPAAARAPEVLGWQRLVLQKNAVCEACNTILPRGTDAAVAVTDLPAPRTILCVPCMEAKTHER
ncbi:MAG: hypothetical protein EP329_07965 [Deltaproteobacteria bacterium]|nr:MAG: hypothetical protein EP329_07965 [Deltaproteobacteria bacterium]